METTLLYAGLAGAAWWGFAPTLMPPQPQAPTIERPAYLQPLGHENFPNNANIGTQLAQQTPKANSSRWPYKFYLSQPEFQLNP